MKRDGVEVRKHLTIICLLKGAFHERPPLPHYASTWDVNVALQYLKGLGPSTDLFLKQLAYKLVMLMALTRPSCSADLSLLSLGRRQFTPEGVTFCLQLWLKCVLKDSGIDVSMFTAHSVCGTSSLAAAMAGVTTNDILKAAD